MPSVLEGRFNGLNGLFAPDKERQNHVVENNHIAHGQDGQSVGNALHGGGKAAFVFGQILSGIFHSARIFVFDARPGVGIRPVHVQQIVLVVVVGHIFSLTA